MKYPEGNKEIAHRLFKALHHFQKVALTDIDLVFDLVSWKVSAYKPERVRITEILWQLLQEYRYIQMKVYQAGYFVPVGVANGFCRMYFRVWQKPSKLYCIQEENTEHRAKHYGLERWQLLICSRDGEPAVEIEPEVIHYLVLPTEDESTVSDFRKWLVRN